MLLVGEYELVVGKLSKSCVYSDYITTPGDVKYLNFEWAELNMDELMLYVLMAKGNRSLYDYNDVERMYKFDLAKG